MPLLLVDDRDGRILSEIQTEDEARRVFDAWAKNEGGLPPYLAQIEIHAHRGTYFDRDTSVAVRPATPGDWLD